MSPAEKNCQLATEILQALRAAGVETICICPGGRNAPLVLACEAAKEDFEVISFFEERSAAFFALGRIRREGAPVAVMTTSGTAAAELLPAMLEASQSGHPLIAVTADRPRRLRGTGAPQTINQLPLFTAAEAPVFDIDLPGQLRTLPALESPIHLNICFDEPLVKTPPATATFGPVPARPTAKVWMKEKEAKKICQDFFFQVRRPLVLVSSLTSAEAGKVAPWLASQNLPLYLESISQLREDPNLQKFSLKAGERILLTPECREAYDGIIRIGGIPTPRLWRTLDHDKVPVLHISRVPLPGLAGPTPVVPLSLFPGCAGDQSHLRGGSQALWKRDEKAASRLRESLAAEPCSEAALVRSLAERLPEQARILLGNSLPIREWDLAAPRQPNERTYFANRGVNGIDGLVSTALGLSGPTRPTVAVLGDLSALYDLVGLWPADQLKNHDITVVVINNGGGQIFQNMFKERVFLNSHQIHLRGWAEMFGWDYELVRSPEDDFPLEGPRLVEIIPDTESTRRFQEAYTSLWD